MKQNGIEYRLHEIKNLTPVQLAQRLGVTPEDLRKFGEGVAAADFRERQGADLQAGLQRFVERGSPAPSGSEKRLEAGAPKEDAEERADTQIAEAFDGLRATLCRFLEAARGTR